MQTVDPLETTATSVTPPLLLPTDPSEGELGPRPPEPLVEPKPPSTRRSLRLVRLAAALVAATLLAASLFVPAALLLPTAVGEEGTPLLLTPPERGEGEISLVDTTGAPLVELSVNVPPVRPRLVRSYAELLPLLERRRDLIAAAAPRLLLPVLFRNGYRSASADLHGVDPGREERLRASAAAALRDLSRQADGLLITPALSRRLGVAAGGSLTVVTADGSSRVLKVLSDRLAGAAAEALVTLPLAQQLAGLQRGQVNAIAILPRAGADPTRVARVSARMTKLVPLREGRAGEGADADGDLLVPSLVASGSLLLLILALPIVSGLSRVRSGLVGLLVGGCGAIGAMLLLREGAGMSSGSAFVAAGATTAAVGLLMGLLRRGRVAARSPRRRRLALALGTLALLSFVPIALLIMKERVDEPVLAGAPADLVVTAERTSATSTERLVGRAGDAVDLHRSVDRGGSEIIRNAPLVIRSIERSLGDELVASSPRLHAALLAGYGARTLQLPVLGVEPRREDAVTGFAAGMISGSVARLDASPGGILLGVEAASELGVGRGDRLRLVASTARTFVAGVVGIYALGDRRRDRGAIVNLRLLQSLERTLPSAAENIALRLSPAGETGLTKRRIERSVGHRLVDADPLAPSRSSGPTRSWGLVALALLAGGTALLQFAEYRRR